MDDEAALEAAIRADPERDDRWLVYGDWLQAKGDPRGELISVQNALAKAKPKGAEAKKLKKAESDLLSRHKDAFLGPLAETRWSKLVWRNGFLRSAGIAFDLTHAAAAGLRERVFEAICGHPSMRFLEELAIGISPAFYGSKSDEEKRRYRGYSPLVAILARADWAARGTLRSLSLVEEMKGKDQCFISVSDIRLGDVSALAASFPGLQRFMLRGANDMILGKLAGSSQLKEFRFETSESAPPAAFSSICDADWSNLERLDLTLGVERCNDKQLRRVLQGAFPALTHLGLHGVLDDSLCGVLLDAPLLKRLATLDLTSNHIGDAGAHTLTERAGALRHLDSLDLSGNQIFDDAAREAALKICKNVELGMQLGFG